jgi:hypothetical protein
VSRDFTITQDWREKIYTRKIYPLELGCLGFVSVNKDTGN